MQGLLWLGALAALVAITLGQRVCIVPELPDGTVRLIAACVLVYVAVLVAALINALRAVGIG